MKNRLTAYKNSKHWPTYRHLGDSWKKKLELTQNWLLQCDIRLLIKITHCHLAPQACGVEPQTAGAIVSFLSFRHVYVFFYQKIKKNPFKFCLLSLILTIFQAIQTAAFYKKMHLKGLGVIYFLMFSDLQGSCDQNKN